MEKVSIILPIYNVEEYIAECLDSIINQTYRNLEIILVDDGSPDGSGKICDEYQQKDDRIVVVHKKNEGVSAARNTGLELATGEYITFADPDDWLESDMIEKMVEVLGRRQADISFCRFHTEIMPEDKQYLYQAIEQACGDGNDALCQMVKSFAYGTMVWNKLFKRNTIFFDNTYIKFCEDLKCGEDEVWLIEVVQNAKKVAYLKDELYYWRVRENSAYRDDVITDIKITDIVAQERALELIKDKESEAYVRILERLNEKSYHYRVKAYINKQDNYVMELTMFREKYSRFWYQSDRIAWQTKIKRRIIEFCVKIRTSRKLVERLYNL